MILLLLLHEAELFNNLRLRTRSCGYRHSLTTSSFLDFRSLIFLFTLFFILVPQLLFCTISSLFFLSQHSEVLIALLPLFLFIFFISKIHVYNLCWYRLSFIVVLHDINVCIMVVVVVQHSRIYYIMFGRTGVVQLANKNPELCLQSAQFTAQNL